MRQLITGFIFISILFSSCEKLILGEAEENTPVNNFEILWTDFDQHYGLFEARGWDWDSIYTVYRPQVTNQSSDQELWEVFANMISYLDDSHTSIYKPNADYFASGSEEDDRVRDEFSLDLLRSKYLENVEELDLTDYDDEAYLIGKIKEKNIGYIYLGGIDADDDNFMDEVLTKIGHHDAIILDLRNNTGGFDEIGASIAGRFADGRQPIYTVQTRNGPNHNDFTEPKTYYTEIQGEQNYREPVIILTDRITVSAAETMLMHFKAIESVTQIGDRTAGDFSDIGMRRFLPNGWQYQYSIMQFLNTNGESLDGIGHIPDIEIRNSVTDIAMEEDKVILRAVQYLFDEYGIE